jgi:catechol 2,3-dioxygenase-like lactoylglutathione lyase family enzyme
MLGDHPITPVLLAKDLAATREFYHDRLGLEILTESDDAIVFRCGGGKVQDYDLPGLKTEDGIADLGFAWMAWIVDPGGNALAIMQLKE